ncbi:MAG: FliI/YscN family ATPase [Betaproteobacteria bacterium]|nr:FliI/YscN family ATPase [Betaproteobacteria bacterium]
MFSANALQKLRQARPALAREPLVLDKLGKVLEVVGTVVEAALPGAPLGALVRIFDQRKSYSIDGEVVGFRRDRALIIPFSDPTGVCANALVQCVEREPKIRVGAHLIGRIVDPYLRPMTGDPIPPLAGVPWSIVREPLNPLLRRRIHDPLDLGVRAMNTMLTCGEGQRVGIMAGSGVGKSVLLGMIARYTQADLNVIALIGERGREVREFLEENLGPEGLARSIVVVSTGDQSPLARIRAAHVATAIADFFRQGGKKVLLMMDSLTRVAMAQREIGLAVGEPPTTKGYTPSVFSMLPRLLEQAGNSDSDGSVTGIYTVLVDGDDFNDPVTDAARSILDGHVNLSRQLAARNHFPAIDILTSASRVMVDITDDRHRNAAGQIREWMATYQKNEDLINIGAYNQGTNPKIDKAIQMQSRIDSFLSQGRNEISNYSESLERLFELTELE